MRRKIGRSHRRCQWFPTKVRYTDYESATRALKDVQRKSKRTTVPVRVYECQCGGFHLTAQRKERG